MLSWVIKTAEVSEGISGFKSKGTALIAVT